MELFRRELRAEAVTAGLVLLSLILLALPEARQTALSRTLNHALLLPLTETRAELTGYLRVRSENARLRSELQRARLERSVVETENAENQALRSLLNFREGQPVRLLPARVIDRDFEILPTTFLIDIGGEDGVQENLPVVSDEGMVGKVVDVGPRASMVMLYSHPDFSASALLVGGDHLEYGVIRPGGGGELHLYLPLRSSSEPGDRIVTSGYGGTFPRGIPLGEVAHVQEDRRLGLQRIDVIDPVVVLGEVTAVFVLRRATEAGESAGDVLRLFWPGYAYPPMAGELLGEGSAVDVDTLGVDTTGAAAP
ncbi:MAG: rod shape-determining protein MreC [Gemmatimonadota bacterium]